MIGSLAATWKVSSAFVGLMEQHRCTADQISDCASLRSVLQIWRLRVRFRIQKKAVEKETAELKRFFGDVFCGKETVVVQPWTEPYCPALDTLQRALQKLPAHKAVPGICAPSMVWKACATTVAPFLHAAFADMGHSHTPMVPHRWKDGWMVLAPKAGKPLCRACDVRPLALQDPGGKAAIRTLKEAIQPYVDEYMQAIPQYAYLQKRDGQMAILRACALVERSLQEAQIPAGLISLVMAWLVGSSYHITHAGEEFTLTPTRGIRQGCVLSPLIWSCVTGTMVRDLESLDIAVADLDLYADDYLHQELLTTYEAFAPALRKMGVIIKYLQDNGLQVSIDKTAVLLRIAGTRYAMAMKQHTFRRKDREGIERLYIKIPTATKELHLPVVQEHKYMGIMATYYCFEDSTLQHRISSAKNAYTRLKPFLRSR
ncbi:unnamed protein product, partial [Symbiodinium necroappetens]